LQSCCLPSIASHYKQDLSEPLSGVGVHGIAAHKVYPSAALLQQIVSSYLTFSPSSRQWRDSYFLWHFLSKIIGTGR